MKRTLLLLLLCLLLCACTPAEHTQGTSSRNPDAATTAPTQTNDPAKLAQWDLTPLPEEDYNCSFSLLSGTNFQETETFYCGASYAGNLLHYYDKTSGISGLLCIDPSCMHEQFSDCGAAITSSGSLSIYKGQRYWVSFGSNTAEQFFYRSDLSGLNQEKLLQISYEDIILPYHPQQYMVHRGRLYIWGQGDTVNTGQVGQRHSLISMSMDGSGELTIIYDKISSNATLFTDLRFAGNTIFLYEYEFVSRSLTISQYDIPTGQTRVLYQEEAFPGTVQRFHVTAAGEVYVSSDSEEGAALWKITDGQRTEVSSRTAAEYRSAPYILSEFAVYLKRTDGVQYADIVALDGEVIYSGRLLPEEIPGVAGSPDTYSRAFLGGNGSYLIMELIGRGAEADGNHMLRLDVHNDMEVTVLWSEVQS